MHLENRDMQQDEQRGEDKRIKNVSRGARKARKVIPCKKILKKIANPPE